MSFLERCCIFFIFFLFCTLVWEVPSFIHRQILKKKCGYDCSKCKNWMCDSWDCKRKREKLESKLKEQ